MYVCKMRWKVFLEEFNRFEFRVQFALLFTQRWREDSRINAFSKGISATKRVTSLVQDLNSCRRVHFQW